MKRIGLIGGMSWESTAVYYRLLNEAVRERLGGLHSAEIVLHSVDFARIVGLQQAGRWDEAARVLGNAAQGLERAGAQCVLICTNTMHLVADQVAAWLSVPLLHIVDVTGQAVRAAGCRRPLLLATRYTAEQGFYTTRLRRAAELDPLVPDEAGRADVHAIIFEELCRGVVRPESHARLMQILQQGIAEGADSVILGCTEICLILDPDKLPCPGFDSTRLHAQAALDFALGASPDSSLRPAA
ncbi:L-aspartate/glutamate-specific racemase [Rhodovastum atsumiense]|uniref:Aspartate/glutamate racemase family protein n=1 Tax=Rhodovastum atsumiense TaxID=504468 RepID=A0A5M6INT2_9PROT|nr:aspartate/glutamate racemase family protein [Rhodovastum atsumiense]KAA5609218.1 aspartate/glutamate racemase family protein [Rhodovastum atsumiense]CAH2603946.1 L-aspartate/glutamate-specific racemase [Rhodovastum atsumiense]